MDLYFLLEELDIFFRSDLYRSECGIVWLSKKYEFDSCDFAQVGIPRTEDSIRKTRNLLDGGWVAAKDIYVL